MNISLGHKTPSLQRERKERSKEKRKEEERK
jgi:hypothetical protein